MHEKKNCVRVSFVNIYVCVGFEYFRFCLGKVLMAPSFVFARVILQVILHAEKNSMRMLFQYTERELQIRNVQLPAETVNAVAFSKTAW